MKRVLLEATVFVSSLVCAHAQQATDSAGVVPAEGKFIRLSKEPEFPGGLTALMHYLNENIHYPDSAFAEDVQGIVTVLFTIDKEGRAVNARLERGIGNGCDEEALRLIGTMPLWSPGMYKGRPVDVLYRLPVHFIIPDKIPEHNRDVCGPQLVYRYVDQAPEFPGGKAALIKYLSAEIPELKDKKRLDNAVLEFLVPSNGKVKHIKLLKSGCSSELEQRLSAVADRLPRWKPAKANGKAVNAYYNIPVNEF